MPQHDVLVLLADEHHLRHLDGGLVRHAQAVHEAHLHPEPLHVARDVRAAAVHHHRVHADVLEEHHVARELLLQLRVDHRGAAVLDHDRLTVELPDVRERLEERCDISHERVLRVEVDVLGAEVAEEDLGLAALAGHRERRTRPRAPLTSSAGAGSTTSPADTTWWPSISRSTTNGSPGGHTWPAAWRMRPKLGSPPWRAVLTSGELAIERATGSTASGAAASRPRGPPAARPRRRARSRARAGAAGRRAPRRAPARPATPAPPGRRRRRSRARRPCRSWRAGRPR